MSGLPNSAAARDAAYVLHPYTNARKLEQQGPLVIERGDGIYVIDAEGNRYIEGLAGLWSAGLGFSEKRLVDAAVRQLNTLPFYHYFMQKSHEPLIDLAERLVAISPARLERVFFANSGSEANDSVIKLVWYYNNALGRPKKKKFISRIKAYHGITIASGSLTGLPGNHQDFDLPLPGFLHTGCPHHYRFGREGESEAAFVDRLAAEFEELILAEGPETVAAFIGEPVMGAGGVIVPPPGYWARMQAICRKYDILLVADEVINGFGRTGQMFGCGTFDIDPDIMVVSKQLTSCYQPLSAVLFSDAVYQAAAENTNRIGTFGHGFTSGGHPVATAVALEVLDIYEERDLLGHVAAVGPVLQKGLRRFADHPLVGEVRGVGMIAAVELVADKATRQSFEKPGAAGTHLVEQCLAQGLIVRNVVDSVAFSPPIVMSAVEVEDMVGRFGRALDDTLDHMRRTGVWRERRIPAEAVAQA